ncbi:MAG: MSMEG_4193 family putative phosphomutase [Propionibacteriales bacterium]|nr:MSMEG_4193 family putative phosphomutase [Propionibacteriales bacterium]
MATVVLVRHARSHANSGGVLAGRSPGVLLDDVGRQQAADTGTRLAVLPLAAVVSSPLERCQQTAAAIAAAHGAHPKVQTDERLTECGYGEWTGRELKQLAKEPLWKVVQAHPSAVTFPGGESMREMQVRGIEAVRSWDARVSADNGSDAIWVAVSHADVIKAILADALGAHLDNFQRIVVDPASVSAISYTPLRPFVVRYNEHGDLSALSPAKKRRRRPRQSDAVVGGGAG